MLVSAAPDRWVGMGLPFQPYSDERYDVASTDSGMVVSGYVIWAVAIAARKRAAAARRAMIYKYHFENLGIVLTIDDNRRSPGTPSRKLLRTTLSVFIENLNKRNTTNLPWVRRCLPVPRLVDSTHQPIGLWVCRKDR